MKDKVLEKYCQFIRIITGLVNEHFEIQKEYIHCREGCAHCCKNGEYPCTKLEFEFLKIGFSILPFETQKIITDKIIQIKAEKSVFKGEKFIHECPFLIDNRCSVYNYRMIICRTFGLAYYEENPDDKLKHTIKSPFCMELGLNYSEVYDPVKKIFSSEKFKKTGYKNEPSAYSLGFEELKSEFGQKVMDIDFGEIKPLIDWL